MAGCAGWQRPAKTSKAQVSLAGRSWSQASPWYGPVPPWSTDRAGALTGLSGGGLIRAAEGDGDALVDGVGLAVDASGRTP
jgi:hypothetical protein